MCERINKAKSVLGKYREKGSSVHNVADMVLKDLEKLRDQLLILEVVYFVASEKAVDDYELHSTQVRETQNQKREQANGQQITNGSQRLRFM